MSRAWPQVLSTTLCAALTLSAAVTVAQPGPPGAAAPPSASSAVDCDPSVAAWARNASHHTGLVITATSCPAGVVRFEIAGAGCDFEVARSQGFQTTPDGKFGVSPIANLDWTEAPEPMKKALAGVLASLAHDPSLALREGEPMRHPPEPPMLLGSRRNQIIAGSAGGALIVAAGVGLVVMKRRRAKLSAPSVPAPAPVEPPASPAS